MIVIDASAVIDALTASPRGAAVQQQLEQADQVAAPELLFAEVASALWRLVRADAVMEGDADRALATIARLNVVMVPHRALLPHAWALRESVRIADAFYLACATRLRTSLLTTDARLARGHHGVPVTLVG